MAGQSYGTVTIGGTTYIEREQTFPLIVNVTANLSIQKVTLVLPGTADFWLKTLTRETVVSGASAARRFSFRLGNSDGGTWYQSGGVGGTTDRVIDTLLFGSGQFPFVLNPYIYYGASGTIPMEIEDISNNQPYSIYFAFRGSYLIPTS
jgi:hypothetical protein